MKKVFKNLLLVLFGVVAFILIMGLAVKGITWYQQTEEQLEDQHKTLLKAAKEWDKGESIGKVQSIIPDDRYFTVITTDKEIFTVNKKIKNIQRNIEVRRIIEDNKRIICFGNSSVINTNVKCYWEKT